MREKQGKIWIVLLIILVIIIGCILAGYFIY